MDIFETRKGWKNSLKTAELNMQMNLKTRVLDMEILEKNFQKNNNLSIRFYLN